VSFGPSALSCSFPPPCEDNATKLTIEVLFRNAEDVCAAVLTTPGLEEECSNPDFAAHCPAACELCSCQVLNTTQPPTISGPTAETTAFPSTESPTDTPTEGTTETTTEAPTRRTTRSAARTTFRRTRTPTRRTTRPLCDLRWRDRSAANCVYHCAKNDKSVSRPCEQAR